MKWLPKQGDIIYLLHVEGTHKVILPSIFRNDIKYWNYNLLESVKSRLERKKNNNASN